MYLLSGDIGNTTAKLVLLEKSGDGEWEQVQNCRMETRPVPEPGQWTAAVLDMLKDLPPEERPVEAVISSVVPEATRSMAEGIRSAEGTEPLVISCESDTGLILDVPEPETIGTDRLADAAWAAANCELPAVTADLGTATTLSVIEEGGVFLGGSITLGVTAQLKSLGDRTAQLPALDAAAPGELIGKTTESNLLTGAVTGTAALIDGMAERIGEELGKDVTLVLTGGHAPLVSPLCRTPHQYEPQLLLKGLALIYEREKARTETEEE